MLFCVIAGALLCSYAQQINPARPSRIVLLMPFENVSNVPGIDWIGESFPEVIGNRLVSASLFLVSRDDRLYALDRLGIPATAKPSRATIYEIAQQLDADYVIVGRYNFDGSIFTATLRRESPQIVAHRPMWPWVLSSALVKYACSICAMAFST